MTADKIVYMMNSLGEGCDRLREAIGQPAYDTLGIIAIGVAAGFFGAARVIGEQLETRAYVNGLASDERERYLSRLNPMTRRMVEGCLRSKFLSGLEELFKNKE